MSKTWIIARHEFTITIRRLSYILLTLSFPLLSVMGIVIYGGVYLLGGEISPDEKRNIGYVDNTGMFVDYTEMGGMVLIAYNTSGEAKSELLIGNISEFYVIPQDYMENGRVSRYTTKREIELPASTIAVIEDFLIANLLSDKVTDEYIVRVASPLNTVNFRLDSETGEVLPRESLFRVLGMPYIFAIMFMMSLLVTSGFLIQGVSEEKENRLMEILLSSVSARQLLTGKVIGLGAAGLLQIMFWFISALVLAAVASVYIAPLADLTIPAGLVVFGIIYFVLGYLLFGILLAAVGAMGATVRESSQLTTIISLPAVLPIILIGLFMSNPDHIVFTILTLFPVTSPVMVVMRLSVGTIPIWELGLSVFIMGASVLAVMWLAGRAFRTFILMYGKRPGFREVWRCLRQG